MTEQEALAELAKIDEEFSTDIEQHHIAYDHVMLMFVMESAPKLADAYNSHDASGIELEEEEKMEWWYA